MLAISRNDLDAGRAALDGLTRDEVYSMKHAGEEFLAHVEERFLQMPEE